MSRINANQIGGNLPSLRNVDSPSGGSSNPFKFWVGSQLPDVGNVKTVYYLQTEDPDIYHQYIWINGEYKVVGNGAESNYERVLISLSFNGGTETGAGGIVKVTISGEGTQEFTISADGTCEFEVLKGKYYTIEFPFYHHYSMIPVVSYTALLTSRPITRIYRYLGNEIRSVVLERSNPDNWTTSGDESIVDDLLNEYGSYVIDEVHKTYAKLSSVDHRIFEDGTPWNGTYGNAFRRFPRVYFRVAKNNDNEPLLQVSEADIDGHYFEEDWIGIYKGAVIDGKLRSIPGVSTTQSRTMSQFWADAQALGMDYGLVDYFDQQKLLALHYAKFGKSNSEETMGPGLQNAGQNYYTHFTGTTAELGDGTGSLKYLQTNFRMNKLFGIEDLAGSTWEFRPNIRFTSNKVIVYEGNVVSNDTPGREFNRILNNASGVYIKKLQLGEYFDIIPIEAGTSGSSSATYYCDGTWAATAGQILGVGGSADYGSFTGLSSAASDGGFSGSAAYRGARLAFKGDISEYRAISGSEMAAENE